MDASVPRRLRQHGGTPSSRTSTQPVVAAERERGRMVAPLAGLSLGLRIIMTVCAVALIESVPEDRTSLGSALNDVSQELGTSVGAAVSGTVLAVLVGSALPEGAWSDSFRQAFFGAEQATYVVVAVIVGLITFYGCSTLTDSRTADEH